MVLPRCADCGKQNPLPALLVGCGSVPGATPNAAPPGKRRVRAVDGTWCAATVTATVDPCVPVAARKTTISGRTPL